MTRRDYTERDIHMALDGELPADEMAGYEAWLEANPDMKARSLRYAADRDQLREAFAHVLAEPLPDQLDRFVAGKPAAASRARRWWMAAAAAALLRGRRHGRISRRSVGQAGRRS